MTDWTKPALELFASHAIDPEVADTCGVREEGGYLVYPTGKRRSLNGARPAHVNPKGQEIRPWWILGQPKGDIGAALITEGETDGLAAACELMAAHETTGFDALPILALPGAQYPPERLVRGLVHYKARDAYLALDADQAGRQARDRLIRTLAHRGIRPIPVSLPEGCDLADFLSAGGDLANLLADAEADAPTVQLGPPSFADLATQPVEWLWRQRIPTRVLTVLAGDPEQGKSMFTVELAAEVSRAGEHVLMASAEDEPMRVGERLRAAGADLSKVHPVEELVLPTQVRKLREQVGETGARLITLDPYTAYFADGVIATKDQQVRRALAPLADIAKDFDLGVVIVCHMNVGSEDTNPIYRIPVGLRGIARSILTMKRAGGHTELVHAKSSYGSRQPAIHYRFDGQRLVGGGGGGSQPGMQHAPVGAGEARATAPVEPAASPSEFSYVNVDTNEDGELMVLDYRTEKQKAMGLQVYDE